MNDKEHIDSFIRKSLDQLEVQPAIPSFELTIKKLEAAQKEKRKRRFFFWFFAGLAVIGISAGVLFYSYGTIHLSPERSGLSKQQIQDLEKQVAEYTNAQNKTRVTDQKNTTTAENKTPAVNKKPAVTASSVIASPAARIANTPANTSASVIASEPPAVMTELETLYTFLPLNKTSDLYAIKYSDTSLKNAGLAAETAASKDRKEEEKKKYIWYAGAGFTPQWTRYSLSAGRNMEDQYTSFSDNYNTIRQNDAKATWNYQAALKSGFMYKDKWIVQFGLGYQVFIYNETIRFINSPVSTGPPSQPPTIFTPNGNGNGLVSGPTGGSVTQFSATSSESYTFKNTFRYAQLSVAGSRVFMQQSFGFYVGAGCSVSRLLPSNALTVEGNNMYTYRYRSMHEPLNKWTCTPAIQLGIMKPVGSRILLQAGPNGFYNLHSMFSNGYIIAQKPYGLGFDLNVLIRLN